MEIIDAHAHIYPEKIARRASLAVGEFYHQAMRFDGTVQTLLRLGDEHGVQRFLVHSVATIPEQVEKINSFIASECRAHPSRLIGFAALHPDTKNPADELERARGMGLKGVKLHPDFQKFDISDPRMDDAYAAMAEMGLPVLIHMGDPRYDWSSPKHVPVILKRHPRLRVICAHFGGYTRWDEAAECLKGEGVWIDTSSSLFMLAPERAKRYISLYGEDHVLFGSDYPMWNVGDEIRSVQSLGLSEETNRKIFSGNLKALLAL